MGLELPLATQLVRDSTASETLPQLLASRPGLKSSQGHYSKAFWARQATKMGEQRGRGELHFNVSCPIILMSWPPICTFWQHSAAFAFAGKGHLQLDMPVGLPVPSQSAAPGSLQGLIRTVNLLEASHDPK